MESLRVWKKELIKRDTKKWKQCGRDKFGKKKKSAPKTFLRLLSFFSLICQQLPLTLTQGCKIMVLCLFHFISLLSLLL